MKKDIKNTLVQQGADDTRYKISFEDKIFVVKCGEVKAFITFSFPYILSFDDNLITREACERIISFYKSLCEEYKAALSKSLKDDDVAKRTLYLRVRLRVQNGKRNTLSFERHVSAELSGAKLCEIYYRDSFRLSSGMLCG